MEKVTKQQKRQVIKRTVNFSEYEKRLLSELVLKYQNVVENKKTDSTTNADKQRGWQRIAEEFNTISTYCHRNHNVQMLKCCWENIKKKAKKDRAETKKKIFMTGGGKPPSPSPSNQGIIDTILGPALEGISNIYDSDGLIDKTIEYTPLADASADDIHEIVYVVEEEAALDELTPKDNMENLVVLNDNKMEKLSECIANTSKNILKESNESNKWSSWTPKLLKTPVSSELKAHSTGNEDKDSWFFFFFLLVLGSTNSTQQVVLYNYIYD